MKIQPDDRTSKEFYEDYLLREASNSNIYMRLSDSTKTMAIISPYRAPKYSDEENRHRMVKFKAEVRKMGYGFNQMVSRWVEDGEAFDEQSLLIAEIDFDTAMKLAKKWEQSSFIFKDADGLREICSTSFEKYKPGDVVRVYSTKDNEIFNFEIAREVFAKRRGGPVSKLIKGSNSQPYQFKTIEESFELYEANQPRPSYFQDKYTYERIL